MIIISEIGLNYNGNIENCKELIKQSKNAGADIAKFQLGWKGKSGEINHLDKNKLKKLYDWAEKYDIEIMFSVFNEESLDLLKHFPIKKIKIASRTLIDDFNLCKKIVDLGYFTIISLGMWKNKNSLPFLNQNVNYLWCNSVYPTLRKDLINLPKKFLYNKKIIGYSDHYVGIEVALMAITRGATIIEKHFTLDKSSKFIRDHQLSAEPNEMKNLISLGREINKNLKSGI